MQTWMSLTPEERSRAREQYRNLQRIPPEKREALRQKWNAYKELPSEEKERFTEAAKKPPVKPVAPKAGAKPIKPLTAPPPPRPAPRSSEAARPGRAATHRRGANCSHPDSGPCHRSGARTASGSRHARQTLTATMPKESTRPGPAGPGGRPSSSPACAGAWPACFTNACSCWASSH
jgi:hypothetical protein